MSTPNWGNLVAGGRARASGVPATEQEMQARSLGIPKEYYFAGIHTLEDYDKARKQDEKKGAPVERLPRNELIGKVVKLGIAVTPDVSDATLVQLLTNPAALKTAKAEAKGKVKADQKVAAAQAKADKVAAKAKDKAEKEAVKDKE